MARRKKRKTRRTKKKRHVRRYPLTITIDLDKDGKPDVVRVYSRKKREKVHVANVKFSTTKMGRKKKK